MCAAHHPYVIRLPFSVCVVITVEVFGLYMCLFLYFLLQDNLFEWHFTIRGPCDSDFDGGVYHGRIILPPDYPMKPPSIMFLTQNGRFECFTKICLSISKHHPESWQPSWSSECRTIFHATLPNYIFARHFFQDSKLCYQIYMIKLWVRSMSYPTK